MNASTAGPAPGRFDGQTALVTGAASGIGAATSRLLAARGARVLLADRDEAALARLAGELGQPWLVADVSRQDSVNGLAGWARQETDRLDVVVHSAGIEGRSVNLADMPVDEFDNVVAVNLRGAFLVMRAFIPWLLATGGGAWVNVASPLGLVGAPGAAAYCASKAGVIQLTKVAAIEYSAQGLRANCVCPGITATPMTERGLAESGPLERYDNLLNRMAAPEEIAETILFLASPAAAFVIGSALIVDGGKLTW